MTFVDLTGDEPAGADMAEAVLQISDKATCPVCCLVLPAEELAAHCDAHFPAHVIPQAASEPAAACHVCGLMVALVSLEIHELEHQAAGDITAAGQDVPAAACCYCGHMIALEHLESHEMVHALEEGGQHKQPDGASAAEQRQWQELRQQFGFARRQRPGRCRVCSQENHWASECPRNPDNIAALSRVVNPPLPHTVAAAQRPDPQWQPTSCAAALHFMQRLAACLRDEAPPAGARAGARAAPRLALLCGPVLHFGGQQQDAGWGCGYRNIQMQLSHLLATSPAAAAALFRGCGYVPDVISLQAWIECAWRAGFDREGAEQLGQSLQAGQKWIGTTEAAAVLRFFGVRATIADFGVNAGGQRPDWSAASTSAPAGNSSAAQPGLEEVHIGVACDGCGARSFTGPRYCSEVLPSFDLCGSCFKARGHPAVEPFRRVLASGCRPAADRSAGAAGGKRAAGASAPSAGGSPAGERMLEWVWQYFSSGEDAQHAGGPHHPLQGGAAAAGPAVVLTGRSPLYLQHEGHSRTVIGIERSAGSGGRAAGTAPRHDYTLFVLDPAAVPAAVAGAVQSGQGWQRLLKRGARTLRKMQYQVLYCPDVALAQPGTADYEALKGVTASERFA